MAYTSLFNISVLLIWVVVHSTHANSCLKSFPSGTPVPDDELMNALYLADPNDETGFLRIYYYTNNVEVSMEDNSLGYDSWLAREHDAQKEMINLWNYIINMAVSDVPEVYAHYRVIYDGGSKPRGIVNWDTIANLFANACYDWNTVSDVWPYSCLDSAFFCNMQYALDSLKQLVVETNWEYTNGQFIQEVSLKSIGPVRRTSYLGVDSAERSMVINNLFSQDVLKFIPESVQDNVFYQSPLMWDSISKLLEGKSTFDGWIGNWLLVGFQGVEDEVMRQCSQMSGQPVAIKYYCKAKSFTELIRTCASLSDVSPCLYDVSIQELFIREQFDTSSRMNLINSIIATTQTVLTNFKNEVVANNRDGLNSLYNQYNPYVTVNDSMCHIDWPNTFDCTDNAGCDSYDNSHKFDCNGGYTCRINMMYRFDCLLKFVLKQTKQLVDALASSGNWASSDGIKAKNDLMLWLSYLPMARYTSLAGEDINSVILTTQNTVNDFLTKYDTQKLKTFVTNLPPMSFVPQWAKDAACQQTTIPTEYIIFCNLDPLLNSVFLFIQTFEHSQKSTTKVLNPTSDYRTLLGQIQLQRGNDLITLQTQEISNQFSNEVQQNFEELSSYFSSLADYDKTKADADIGYIDGQLTVFKNRISSVSTSVEKKFDKIFKLAIGTSTAELLSKTVELGVAIATLSNPLGTILGESSLLEVMDRLSSLAQAGVTAVVIDRLGREDFKDLMNQARDLGNNLKDNEGQLKDAKNLIDLMKDGKDAVGLANDFLGKYNGYTPKVLLADITSFGAKWETVTEQLCEAAFSSESATAALVEIGLASTGDCVNVGNEIEELITFYEELYDYQFDFMDSMSDAARAYLAYNKAIDLKSAYTSKSSVNQAFMKQTAVNAFMVSTLNIWELVTEYCDALTYTRGGEVPDKCEVALRTPSHMAVAQVMGFKPDPICHGNNEATSYRNIPTAPTDDNDQAYIDLNALYAGETVTFKIPNFQWLRDNGWFSRDYPEQAIYISRFEIFLPPMSGLETHTIEVEVQPGMANYLKPGGNKYLLPVSGYTTEYTENSVNCYVQRTDNPYALCNDDDLVKMCIISNGNVNRTIQPSIYNEWKIRALSLPANQVAPQPVTNFKIQAGITMCKVNLSPSAQKRETPTINRVLKGTVRNRTRRAEHHCCASNQYWSGSQCSTCPAGSSQQLLGVYCQ